MHKRTIAAVTSKLILQGLIVRRDIAMNGSDDEKAQDIASRYSHQDCCINACRWRLARLTIFTIPCNHSSSPVRKERKPSLFYSLHTPDTAEKCTLHHTEWLGIKTSRPVLYADIYEEVSLSWSPASQAFSFLKYNVELNVEMALSA